ncbi:MAG: hypothetical protein OHK0046_45050 [Anaerolineae bacterium]
MNALRNLTVNQMIAVVALVLVLLIAAMFAFNESRREPDPASITPTVRIVITTEGGLRFGNATATPETTPAP